MIRIAGTVLAALALAAAWLFLAPAQLGGSTGYVVLYGTSMEPRYSAGDLVLVRPADDPAVGDVVAYRHPRLGRMVLHRVVARDGDRLQFKGDNNDFLDLPRASEVEVVGREWVHLPAVGSALEWVRQPLPAAAAVLFCTLLLLAGGASVSRRRRALEPPAPDDAMGRRAVEALVVFGGLVLLALGLGVLAWSRPLEGRAPWPGRWEHEARLSYRADVAPTPVYPSGRVTTGETVFTQQASRLRFRVDYRLRAGSEDAVRIGGSVALRATIRGDNGWRRTLTLAPPRALSGPATTLEGELGLAALSRLAQRVEALTGTHAGGYELTVAAPVRVEGAVGDDVVRERFAPTFAFSLHDGRLEDADAASWKRSQRGTGTRLDPAVVRLGPLRVEVRALRYAAVAVGMLGLLVVPFGLAYVAAARRRAGGGADPLGAWLVDVARVPDAREVRDVRSPESLARLAAHYDAPVLRVQRQGGCLLSVELDGVLYRHLVGEVEDWPTEPRPLPVTHLRERLAR